jgi:hypothetical protein
MPKVPLCRDSSQVALKNSVAGDLRARTNTSRAASAFGVGPADVAVGLLLVLTPPPGSRVLLQRQPEDLPGDFPA